MERKLIFLDIDGTLTVPGGNTPPESALKAIKRAQEKGHRVFLCTGRNYGMLSPLLQYGFDGFIGSSGGYIECEGKTIYDCPMTAAQQRRILDALEEAGVFYTIEAKDGSFTDDGFKEFLREHAEEGANSELLRWREQIEESLNIQSVDRYQGQPIYKVVIMSDGMGRLDKPRELLEDEFEFCIQEPDSFGFVNGEIVNRKFDKGKGLKLVCEHLGARIQDTIAFGDSANDIEMMETAALSICMENGSKALKELADDVCPGVTDDGLYHAFEKYGFL